MPPNTQLKPGATGSEVKKLQDYLVSQGLLTQQQVNTGYGTYGPQTTAAVLQLQKNLGIDYSSGPGYFGPKTIAALQPKQTPAAQQPATGLGSAEYTNRLLSSTPGVSVNVPQTQPVTQYFNPQTGAINVPYVQPATQPVSQPIPQPIPTTPEVPQKTVAELTGGSLNGSITAPVATSSTLRESRAAGIAATKAEMLPQREQPVLKSEEEYKKLYSEGQVGVDKEELSAIQNEARIAKEELRQFKQTSGQTLSEAGYLGGISEAERNLNFRLEGLAIREQAVLSRIATKNDYINTIMGLKQQDYQNATTQYDKEYARNTQAIDAYNQQLNNAEKSALTSATTTINLLKSSGIDYSQLDASTRQQIDSNFLAAGIPLGIAEAVYSGLDQWENLTPIKATDASGNEITQFMKQNKQTGEVKLIQAVKTGVAPTTSGNKLTLSEAKKLKLPTSLVGKSEAEIGQDLELPAPPQWFIDMTQERAQTDFMPSRLKTMWDEFRGEVSGSRSSASTSVGTNELNFDNL